jgi:hypothetical protein
LSQVIKNQSFAVYRDPELTIAAVTFLDLHYNIPRVQPNLLNQNISEQKLATINKRESKAHHEQNLTY